MPSDDKSSHCLWQSELKIKCHKILHVSSAHNHHKNFLRHMKLFSVRTKHLMSAHNMNIADKIHLYFFPKMSLLSIVSF
jgi:hypothetical protein